MKTWAVLLGVLVGCRGGDSTKSRRTGSAAPVEMITAPSFSDGGAGAASGAAGASLEETEPNDGEDVATPVAIGAIVRGRIEPETDADYYRLDIDATGVLQIQLSGVDGADLSLEILDGAGASLARSERAGTRVKEGLPNVGVAKGRYTLVVRGVPKKKARAPKAKKGAPPVVEPAAPPVAPVYELTAQLVTPPAGAEHELDDDRGTANDLIVADNASGFIGWTGDRDVWKLSVETLSDKNALDLALSAVEGVALELEVADGVGTVLATRKAPRGQALSLKNLLPVVAAGAPPFYYLTVRGDRSNPETAYALHATASVLGPDPELEPNDNADKAQVIAADRTVVHASWTPGDVDCFALEAATAERTVEFTVDTPSDLDIAAEVLVDGKPVATQNKGGKGVAEKVSAVVPANGVVVLRVKSADAAAAVEANYDVTVTETSGTGDNAP